MTVKICNKLILVRGQPRVHVKFGSNLSLINLSACCYQQYDFNHADAYTMYYSSNLVRFLPAKNPEKSRFLIT